MRPAAPPDFLTALRRSRLLADARLASLPGGPPEAVAHALVEAGDLTRFQADKLLLGQWQGLFLGPYRVLSPLGRGGMGIVYLARDTSPTPGGVVRPLLAVKILPPLKAASEPRTRERFLREMVLGQAVPPHPHLARVFDAGEVSGILFIAMEYVPGRTVKAAVTADGPLPVPAAARVFADAADGLAAAHAAGLVHRDFKPSNLMLTPDGRAKLLDFGLAMRVGEELPADPAIVGGPGYALGTMDYIAPEQAANAAAATPASDQYALGCSLYFAAAGCPPFPGGTPAQKLRWHRLDAPPPVRSLRPDVPAGLADIIDTLMAKDPAARYESAAKAAAALRVFADEPIPVVPAVLVTDATDPNEDAVEAAELWADEIIEGPDDEDASGDEPLPAWVWAAGTAGVLLLAMAAGFLTRWAWG